MTAQQPPDPAKDLAFYSAMVEAWVATRMEKDRTLLALAAGGIGLLVTLLTTVGPTSTGQLWLYALGGLSFLATVLLAIRIFDKNSDYLERVVTTGDRGRDPSLDKLDAGMFGSFILGVGVTCVVAAWTGYAKLQEENSMGKQYETKIVTPGETKSLSGVGNLAPAPAPSAVPAASQLTESAPPAPPATNQSTNSSPATSKE